MSSIGNSFSYFRNESREKLRFNLTRNTYYLDQPLYNIFIYCNIFTLFYLYIYLLAIYLLYFNLFTGLLSGGSGYFTCIQNMKSVTTKFKLGGLHEKHVVATWNVGNHLSICL